MPLKFNELLVIGIKNYYCALSKETLNAPTFKANNLNIGFTLGFLLRLELNQKWSISTGIAAGEVGWGFRVATLPNNTFTAPSNRLPNKSLSSVSTEGILVNRFPLLLTYNLKNIERFPLPKKNDSEQLYLFAFDIETIIGVSYNRISPLSTFSDRRESSSAFPSGDSISYDMSYELQRTWGASVIAGLGLQFYKSGKPKFHVLLYYSQGLLNFSNIIVDYRLNGQNFTSILHARGTIAGIQLSYPFRLKTFKKKEPR